IGEGVGDFSDLPVLLSLAEKDAITAADHKLGRGLKREAEAWSEILMVPLDDGPRPAVFPRLANHAEPSQLRFGEGIEKAARIESVHRLREQIVTEAEVERQTPAEFPVILNVRAGI